MGMPRDINQHLTLAQVDGIRQQGAVIVARRIIYNKHYPINSAAVEALLEDELLTPNIVWFKFIHAIKTTLILYQLYRMHSLNS